MTRRSFAMLVLAQPIAAQQQPTEERGQEISFTETVDKHWLKGQKTELHAIAQARAKENPQDLAALLILFEFAITFAKREDMKQLSKRVDAAAKESRGTEFEKYRQLLQHTTDQFAQIDEWAPDMDEQVEGAKGAIPGKPLSFIDIIRALEKDGEVRPFNSGELSLLGVKTTIEKNETSTEMREPGGASESEKGRRIQKAEDSRATMATRSPRSGSIVTGLGLVCVISGFLVWWRKRRA
jgi:hypothetical protein